MENYNYEDLLKEKFANDPKRVLANYNYPDGTEIMDRLKDIGRDNEALKSILYEIVLWKLNRMVVMTDDDVLDKLRQIKDIESPRDAIEKKKTAVEDALQKLLGTKGVRLPMASTFLHFFNPKVFPIIDQRAYRVIFKEEYKEPSDLTKKTKIYFDYLEECIEYYKKNLERYLEFSDIDKYLYQLDKESGNRVRV